jgi:myosin heavy subunit
VWHTQTGFLDKNKDFSVPAHPVLLHKAANRFIKYLFSAANKSSSGAPVAGSGGGGGDSRRGSSIGGRPSAGGGGGGGASSFQFVGVATQFKTSLKHLMETIGFDRPHICFAVNNTHTTHTVRHATRNTTRHDTTCTHRATQPHFVRCIKPNYEQMPNLFDKPRVLPPLYSFT